MIASVRERCARRLPRRNLWIQHTEGEAQHSSGWGSRVGEGWQLQGIQGGAQGRGLGAPGDPRSGEGGAPEADPGLDGWRSGCSGIRDRV